MEFKDMEQTVQKMADFFKLKVKLINLAEEVSSDLYDSSELEQVSGVASSDEETESDTEDLKALQKYANDVVERHV